MTGLDLFLIFGLLFSLFIILGLSRSWRVATVSFAFLMAYTAYDWMLPISTDPADQVGQQAWRLILLILVIGCAVVFSACFGASKLRARRNLSRANEATQ
jgi:hypothetical protein